MACSRFQFHLKQIALILLKINSFRYATLDCFQSPQSEINWLWKIELFYSNFGDTIISWASSEISNNMTLGYFSWRHPVANWCCFWSRLWIFLTWDWIYLLGCDRSQFPSETGWEFVIKSYSSNWSNGMGMCILFLFCFIWFHLLNNTTIFEYMVLVFLAGLMNRLSPLYHWIKHYISDYVTGYSMLIDSFQFDFLADLQFWTR